MNVFVSISSVSPFMYPSVSLSVCPRNCLSLSLSVCLCMCEKTSWVSQCGSDCDYEGLLRRDCDHVFDPHGIAREVTTPVLKAG